VSQNTHRPINWVPGTPRINAVEARNTSFRNVWGISSISPHVFIAWCLIVAHENEVDLFTLYLLLCDLNCILHCCHPNINYYTQTSFKMVFEICSSCGNMKRGTFDLHCKFMARCKIPETDTVRVLMPWEKNGFISSRSILCSRQPEGNDKYFTWLLSKPVILTLPKTFLLNFLSINYFCYFYSSQTLRLLSQLLYCRYTCTETRRWHILCYFRQSLMKVTSVWHFN
jgi:hypothetical protein